MGTQGAPAAVTVSFCQQGQADLDSQHRLERATGIQRAVQGRLGFRSDYIGSKAHSCASMLPSWKAIRLKQRELKVTDPFWRCQIPAVMLTSCIHLAAKLRELHRVHLVATLGMTMPRQRSSIQGK